MGAYSACKALVVGVGRYADPQYDLSYARSDAEAMAELLGNEFGFDQVWTLYDDDASRQSIIRFFEQDLQRLDEADGLVIFFAGHGITVTSAIGDDRGFLVPHDGDPKEPYANLSLTTIRDDYLPMIPAKHVFLIVDACYGGLALRDVTATESPECLDETVLAELTRRDRKVRQVLAAGTKDQRVLDGGLFGHSVFTGRLIEALREADPYITADHVGVHVRERVARDGADRRHRQTPQFGYLIGGDGSFVFHRKKLGFVAPSASPEVREPVAAGPHGAGCLESLLAGHALGETRAARILNEWSLKRPKYLSPLCDHAKLERVENRWAIRIEIEILVEDRSLGHEIVPYLADVQQHIQPFKEDIWSIPFRPPESFVKKDYSYRASAPDQVAACKECNGSGKWICPSCHGKKEVMCGRCDGTGWRVNEGFPGYTNQKYDHSGKCQDCNGAKKLPCKACKGADPHPCGTCGATGKVLLYPVIRARFRVEEKTGHFSESGIKWDISEFAEILLGQSVAQGAEVPSIPELIPATVRRKIEAHSGRVFQGIAGRVHRTGMSFLLVPFAETHLRYVGRPFAMLITGVKQGVLTTGWVPPNRRRVGGLYAGIPLAALFAAGAIASGVLTGKGTLDAATGTLLIVGASLGVLGAVGYLLWALLSKPKPPKGAHPDAL